MQEKFLWELDVRHRESEDGWAKNERLAPMNLKECVGGGGGGEENLEVLHHCAS